MSWTCCYKISPLWLAQCAEKGLSHCDILGRLKIAVSVSPPRDFPVEGAKDIYVQVEARTRAETSF